MLKNTDNSYIEKNLHNFTFCYYCVSLFLSNTFSEHRYESLLFIFPLFQTTTLGFGNETPNQDGDIFSPASLSDVFIP